jgi:hypothetical protein
MAEGRMADFDESEEPKAICHQPDFERTLNGLFESRVNPPQSVECRPDG